MIRLIITSLFTILCSTQLNAQGLLGIDHRLNFDNSGIWSRSNQKTVQMSSALIVVGGALWEGTESRLGQTFWKSTESMLMAGGIAQAGKFIFRRERPRHSNNADAWFKSARNMSFPSGEATHITAIVTPFIAEYSKDNPVVWALGALPIYVGIARMKSQAHWQSDVLAGMALGVATGLYAGDPSHHWLVQTLPGGFQIGYKNSF